MNHDPHKYCHQCSKIKDRDGFRWFYGSGKDVECCEDCFNRLIAEREDRRKEMERTTE